MEISEQQARQLCQAGELDAAARMVARLLKQSDDGRLWELQGLIQADLGEWKSALESLETASLLVPLKLSARVALAEAYSRDDLRDLARDLFRQLLEETELTVELLLQIATELDRLDQPNLSLQACRRVVEREPELARGYYDMGYYAARCGYPRRVVESLARKAVHLAPERLNYRVGLASLLATWERPAEAHTVIQSLTNEQLENINCRCCLERIADIYETASDWRRAVLCREQLLRLEARGGGSDCE